jgi:hypothetical protein
VAVLADKRKRRVVGLAAAAVLVVPLSVLVMLVAFIANIGVGWSAGGGMEPSQETQDILASDWTDQWRVAAVANDIPWTVLAAISLLATENGKFSPYPEDTVDRAPERPLIAAAPTGGASVALPVAVVGDRSCTGTAAGAWRAAFSGATVTVSCADPPDLAAQVRATTAQVVVVSLAASPFTGDLPAAIDAVVAARPNTQMVWTTVPGAAEFNVALRAAASRHARFVVADVATAIDANPPWRAPDGSLTADGRTAVTGVVANSVNAHTRAGAGASPMTLTPAPDGVTASSFPEVTPPIGGGDNQGVGPYLLTAAAAASIGEPQSFLYHSSSDPTTATELLAGMLASIRDDMVDEGWDFGGDDNPEAATAAWTEAVRRLPVVDPRRTGCVAPTFVASADADQNRLGVARVISAVWTCVAQGDDELFFVRRVTGATPVVETSIGAATTAIVAEALEVAWRWSSWGAAACDPGAPLAGVFPLDADTFAAHRDPSGSDDRCDVVANVTAAARAFVAGESVPVTDPARAGTGPFRAMVGGWAAFPWVLGGDETRARFAVDGPWQPRVPSAVCTSAVFAWADAVSAAPDPPPPPVEPDPDTTNPDTPPAAPAPVPAPSGFGDPPPEVRSRCGATTWPDRAWGDTVAAVVALRAAEYRVAATPRSAPTPGDGVAGDVPVDGIGLVDDVPVATPLPTVTADEALRRADRLDRYATQRRVGDEPFVGGVTSAVARLSPVPVARPDLPAVPPAPFANDYATHVVALATDLGGLFPGDGRVKETGAFDVLIRFRAMSAGAGGFGALSGAIPFADVFNAAGERYGVDPRALAAIAYIESGFADDVVNCTRLSSAGARGIMQLMPATAAGLGVDPCIPEQGIDGGARLVAGYLRAYAGDWDKVAIAYNCGPGCLRRASLPVETQNYIPKFHAKYAELKTMFPEPLLSAGVGEGRMEPSPTGPICVTEAAGFTVNCSIAGQTAALVAAAAADGLHFTGSAYRSHQRQIELRSINGCPDVWTARPSSCRVPTAIPGNSMHEVGLAIDFANCGTRSTACYAWLARNAERFGFFNLPSEPWHWSVNGR